MRISLSYYSLSISTSLLNIRKLSVPLVLLNHAHRLEFLQYTCSRSHDRNRDTTRGASISIHLGRLARNPPPIALSPRSRDSPPCETLRPTPGGGSRTLTEHLLLRHALDADLLHLPLCKFGLDDGRKVGVRALAYQKPQRGVKPLEKLVVVLDDGPVACGRLMVSPRGDGLPGGRKGRFDNRGTCSITNARPHARGCLPPVPPRHP